jgi:hypothetical protein
VEEPHTHFPRQVRGGHLDQVTLRCFGIPRIVQPAPAYLLDEAFVNSVRQRGVAETPVRVMNKNSNRDSTRSLTAAHRRPICLVFQLQGHDRFNSHPLQINSSRRCAPVRSRSPQAAAAVFGKPKTMVAGTEGFIANFAPKPDRAHFIDVLRSCRSVDAQNVIAAQKEIVIAVCIPVVQPVMPSQVLEVGCSRHYSDHNRFPLHHGVVLHVQIWVDKLRKQRPYTKGYKCSNREPTASQATQ